MSEDYNVTGLTAPDQGSHAVQAPAIYRARIEAIDDPQKRNRVQVRMHLYQEDQANFPKSALEWVHAIHHDSQMPGATSTHKYHPGAEVLILDAGFQKFVLGATQGFDGETRLQSNPWGQDTSSNQKPDGPNIVRGSGDTTTRTGSGGLMGGPGQPAGANTYLQYQNFMNQVKLFAYATGKGAAPAPFGQGDPSKSDALKTIALQKTAFGADVLNIIQQLDGNASGSIKAALQIILNLRNNGFGNAMNMIGAGLFNQALSQYSSTFGSSTQVNLVNLLQQLLQYISQVGGMNGPNFYNNAVAGNVSNIITFLGNETFNVGQSVLNDMLSINNNVLLSGNNGNIGYYTTLCNNFQADFASAVLQAFNSVLNYINTLALGTDINTFITLFGGTAAFIQFAQVLQSIGVYLGMPQSAINIIGANTIGMALGNGLNTLPVIQPSGPNISSQTAPPNPLVGLLAIFTGNPIAKAELLGGGLIKTFLSGNAIKYKSDPRNDGPGVLKQFGS